MPSPDHEQVFLGALLLRPELAAEVGPLLEPDDLQNERVRLVYSAIQGMLDEGLPPGDVDYYGIARRMSTSPETQGKIALWLSSITDGLPRVVSLESEAREIRRRKTLQLAAQRLAALSAKALNGDGGMIESDVAALAVELTKRDDRALMRAQFSDYSSSVAEYLDQIALGGSAPGSIPTGIHALDERMGGGLMPGKLHVICGATGAGKTMLASQIADYAAQAGVRTVMFSMEVDPHDVFVRDVEREANVSRWTLRHPGEREEAMSELVKAIGRIEQRSSSKVVYGRSVSVDDIYRAVMVEASRLGGAVGLVVVDHAQVVAPGKEKVGKGAIRYLEVKAIAEALRSHAARMRFAVLLTAQLNPPPKGERPSITYVRESKDIVNAADVALVIHHEREEEPVPASQKQRRRLGKIVRSEILIDKQRTGYLGWVPVQFDGATFTFSDVPQEEMRQWNNE